MNVDYTKAFNKQFEKLTEKRQKQARAAVALFLQDVAASSLRNHALKGEWFGYRSISAGGDFSDYILGWWTGIRRCLWLLAHIASFISKYSEESQQKFFSNTSCFEE